MRTTSLERAKFYCVAAPYYTYHQSTLCKRVQSRDSKTVESEACLTSSTPNSNLSGSSCELSNATLTVSQESLERAKVVDIIIYENVSLLKKHRDTYISQNLFSLFSFVF